MNRIARTSFVIILLLLINYKAHASPDYPFEGLLPRAETIFIGRVITHTDQDVTFQVVELLRGHADQANSLFRYSGFDDRRLSEVTVPCLVISQGDNHFGKPDAIVSLGQYVKGQAGYRGWIAFPIRMDGDRTYVEFAYTRVRQKPGEKPARLTMAEARTLIRQVPYKPDLHGNGV